VLVLDDETQCRIELLGAAQTRGGILMPLSNISRS
jgi:hypothetical protein